MNENNHIDGFFRKNLDSARVSTATSELVLAPLVWEKAHAEIKEFYRKKKKRRFLVILFVGVGIALGSVYFLKSSVLNDGSGLVTTIKQNVKHADLVTSGSELSVAIETVTKRSDAVTEKSDELTKNVAVITQARIEQKEALVREANTAINPQILVFEANRQKDISINIPTEDGWSQVVPAENISSEEVSVLIAPTSSSRIASLYTIIPISKISLQPLYYRATLPIIHMNNFWFDSSQNAETESIMITQKKWKIGLAHSRFVSNPFTSQKENVGLDRSISLIESSYQSLDFSLERTLSRHLSVVTGVNYFRQAIDVSFDLRNLVYDGEKDVNDLLVLTRDAFTRNVLRNSNDLRINFLPTASVVAGDLLDFKGNIPITLHAIQIPFSLKYRQNIGRLGLWASSGIVGTYMKVGVEDLPVKITKNDVLVSNDINYSPVFDSRFLPNVSLAFGTEVRLTQNLNLSASLYTFNFNNDYLRFNVGLNYEF